MNPATGNSVTNGVVEISVDYSSASGSHLYATIGNLALAALPSGIDAYDFTYIVFANPPDIKVFGDDSVAGVAYMPGGISWYNDEEGSNPYAMVHEIGHNLGLAHSGYNGDEYGDPTCTMGSGYYDGSDDSGKICFNGPKMYYLGWYSSYHEDIIPASTSYIGELVGTNDIATTTISSSTYDYIVKLSGTDGATDLFVFYNKVEGIVSEIDGSYSTTFDNHVVVYEQPADIRQSELKTVGLLAGQTYTQTNWAGTSNSLKIEVCSITAGTPDVAKIIIYVNGLTTASCNTATPAPTTAPVTSPTVCTDRTGRFPVVKPDGITTLVKSCKW